MCIVLRRSWRRHLSHRLWSRCKLLRGNWQAHQEAHGEKPCRKDGQKNCGWRAASGRPALAKNLFGRGEAISVASVVAGVRGRGAQILGAVSRWLVADGIGVRGWRRHAALSHGHTVQRDAGRQAGDTPSRGQSSVIRQLVPKRSELPERVLFLRRRRRGKIIKKMGDPACEAARFALWMR